MKFDDENVEAGPVLAWLETFVTLQSESVWIVESCVESRSPHHHQAGLGQFYHFLNIELWLRHHQPGTLTTLRDSTLHHSL